MALPSSGPIAISQLRAEFGGSAPDSLSEYYRGGGRVPNVTRNHGIPTSGAISLHQFRGSALEGAFLQNHTLTCSGSSKGGGAGISLLVLNNGDLSWQSGPTGVSHAISPAPSAAEWSGVAGKSAGDGNEYQVRLLRSSGGLTATSQDTWLALSSSRTFSCSASSVGNHTGTFTLQIRRGTGSVLDSCTITFNIGVG